MTRRGARTNLLFSERKQKDRLAKNSGVLERIYGKRLKQRRSMLELMHTSPALVLRSTLP